MGAFDTWFFVLAALAAVAVVTALYRESVFGGVAPGGPHADSNDRSPGATDGEAPFSVTSAVLDCPVWLFGTEGAEGWVFPPRREDGATVRIVDLSDPHTDGDAGEDRDAVIDGGSLVITELMWALCDLRACDLALVLPEQGRVFTSTAESVDFEDVAPALEGEDPARSVMVWGVATSAAEATVRLGFRLPGSVADLQTEGSVPEVAAVLLGALEDAGLLTAVEPPPWYRAPAAEDLPLYARLLDNLHLLIAADRTNELIAPLDRQIQRGLVEKAHVAAGRPGAEGAQWSLIAAITALYAHRAGGCTDEQRWRVVADILEVDGDLPLAKLAPHLLAELGEPERAARAWRDLRPTADGAYARWLDSLEIRDGRASP